MAGDEEKMSDQSFTERQDVAERTAAEGAERREAQFDAQADTNSEQADTNSEQADTNAAQRTTNADQDDTNAAQADTNAEAVRILDEVSASSHRLENLLDASIARGRRASNVIGALLLILLVLAVAGLFLPR